jgi:hypothetical protein
MTAKVRSDEIRRGTARWRIRLPIAAEAVTRYEIVVIKYAKRLTDNLNGLCVWRQEVVVLVVQRSTVEGPLPRPAVGTCEIDPDDKV